MKHYCYRIAMSIQDMEDVINEMYRGAGWILHSWNQLNDGRFLCIFKRSRARRKPHRD